MSKEYKAVTGLLSIDINECSEDLNAIYKQVSNFLANAFNLNEKTDVKVSDGLMHVLSSSDENSLNSNLTITVRFYHSVKLMTISLDGCCPMNTIELPMINADANNSATTDDEKIRKYSRLNNNALELLNKDLLKLINTKRIEKIPLIKRGSSIDNYFSTSDERVIEYDFNKLIFDGDSKYQNVRIYQSPSFGNALFLDGLQNLADSDLPYTQGIMNFGVNQYENKEILILGGGDGGLLFELLKENPKFVTMIDIDQMVIDACRKHLRNVCGTVLDQLNGVNYEIIIDDCFVHLEKYIDEKRKFDYIFNDLTDIPLSGEHTAVGANLWAFVKRVLNLSLSCLNDNGKYLNHSTGSGSIEALKTYERILMNLPVKVKFSSHKAFVPSFLEEWVFYEIWKDLDN